MLCALNIEFGVGVVYSEAPPAFVWGNVKFGIMPDTTSVRAALEFVTNLGWGSILEVCAEKEY